LLHVNIIVTETTSDGDAHAHLRGHHLPKLAVVENDSVQVVLALEEGLGERAGGTLRRVSKV
jgi:hypothetical protein